MNIKITGLFAFLLIVLIPAISSGQDTYSIVAMDTVTGEVGSAGASCVDLFQTSLSNDDFIGVLFPNKGAINSQAYYIPTNQNNATTRMNAGDSPQEIIDWLLANDVNGTPQLRQYGIVATVDGSPQSVAHTGTSTDDYKGHIIGRNYAIQGNILKGEEVLTGMQNGFVNTQGDLACKLMGALQGANMVGADSRCASNGTSALFAYVKVAQPSDAFGFPSLVVSVRTRNGARIEPVDSLQTKFDLVHSCQPVSFILDEVFDEHFKLFPNPASNVVLLKNQHKQAIKGQVKVINSIGEAMGTIPFLNDVEIDLTDFVSGVYTLQIQSNIGFCQKRIIKN